MEKNFKNTSNNWQVWADVFSKDQCLVYEGTETECMEFLKANNPEEVLSDYGNLFVLAPHTGRNEKFEKFDC